MISQEHQSMVDRVLRDNHASKMKFRKSVLAALKLDAGRQFDIDEVYDGWGIPDAYKILFDQRIVRTWEVEKTNRIGLDHRKLWSARCLYMTLDQYYWTNILTIVDSRTGAETHLCGLRVYYHTIEPKAWEDMVATDAQIESFIRGMA